MKSLRDHPALFYPFHLCHERTLQRLLVDYPAVHFREYMALQLTPFSGTTAFADRMGDYFPALLASGQVVQGYLVSGPLDPEMSEAIDRDLADDPWRALFHAALTEDRRFQRGLLDLSHAMHIGNELVPGPAGLLKLTEARFRQLPFSLGDLRRKDGRPKGLDAAYDDEYRLALIKTAASLWYTIRLCNQHGLDAVTDSAPHFRLLERTCQREQRSLPNHLVPREGY
jgi:hypothetical protein